VEWGYPRGEPVILPDPAAGDGFEYSPPGPVHEQIQAVTFRFTAAAGGGARLPFVAYLDGTGQAFAVSGAPFNLAGGQAGIFSFFVGGNQYGANAAAHIGGPLPAVWLDMRSMLAVDADGIAAGDQFSRVRLFVVSRPIGREHEAD
jgi:hypothetical protein